MMSSESEMGYVVPFAYHRGEESNTSTVLVAAASAVTVLQQRWMVSGAETVSCSFWAWFHVMRCMLHCNLHCACLGGVELDDTKSSSLGKTFRRAVDLAE